VARAASEHPREAVPCRQFLTPNLDLSFTAARFGAFAGQVGGLDLGIQGRRMKG
jgi:hypothetical protein